VDHKSLFMKLWDKEAVATRKVLARIPEGSDYRPDPKSRTAREIAWVMIIEEAVLADGLEKRALAWNDRPLPHTMAEVLAAYDTLHAGATKTLQGIPADVWETEVPFLWEGQEVMRAPGYEMAWGFLLDQIHHRGQISTYLRPMGSTVPAIYGPSADEE
jgi:uncharacterized damage-inducible protein DinB